MGPEVWPTLLALHGKPALHSDIRPTNCSRSSREEWKDILKPQRVLHQNQDDLAWSGHHVYSIWGYMASVYSPWSSITVRFKLILYQAKASQNCHAVSQSQSSGSTHAGS